MGPRGEHVRFCRGCVIYTAISELELYRLQVACVFLTRFDRK